MKARKLFAMMTAVIMTCALFMTGCSSVHASSDKNQVKSEYAASSSGKASSGKNEKTSKKTSAARKTVEETQESGTSKETRQQDTKTESSGKQDTQVTVVQPAADVTYVEGDTTYVEGDKITENSNSVEVNAQADIDVEAAAAETQEQETQEPETAAAETEETEAETEAETGEIAEAAADTEDTAEPSEETADVTAEQQQLLDECLSEVDAWINRAVSEYDESDPCGSIADCFIEGTSDDDITEVFGALSELLANGQYTISITECDDSHIIALIYEDNGDGTCSGHTYTFERHDGTAVFSMDLFSQRACSYCGGRGLVFSGIGDTCEACGGSGFQYVDNTIYNPVTGQWEGSMQFCSECGGYGSYVNYSACPVCNGWGIAY